MDLSRELSDEEICDLIGSVVSREARDRPMTIKDRAELERTIFNSLRKLDVLQELVGNNTAQQHEEGDQHFVHPANGQHNAHPGGGEGQRPATFAAQQMAGCGGDVIDGGALDGQQVETEHDHRGHR